MSGATTRDDHGTPAEPAVLASTSAWDDFVQAAEPGSYLQLAPWAAVKRTNGWTATRIGVEVPPGAGRGSAPIGAQVLLRRPGPLPWAFAYAPRGPVTGAWRPELVGPFTEAARAGLGRAGERVSHLRIDAEVERHGPSGTDGSLRAASRAARWRRHLLMLPAFWSRRPTPWLVRRVFPVLATAGLIVVAMVSSTWLGPHLAGHLLGGGLPAPLRLTLARGPLARRLLRALGPAPSRETLAGIYRRLGDCLATGTMFHA